MHGLKEQWSTALTLIPVMRPFANHSCSAAAPEGSSPTLEMEGESQEPAGGGRAPMDSSKSHQKGRRQVENVALGKKQ